jgi:hypothetical protein
VEDSFLEDCDWKTFLSSQFPRLGGAAGVFYGESSG